MKICCLLLLGLASAVPTPDTSKPGHTVGSLLKDRLSPLLPAFGRLLKSKEMKEILKDKDNMTEQFIVAYSTVETNISRLNDFDQKFSEQLSDNQRKMYEAVKNTTEAKLLLEKFKSYCDYVSNNISAIANLVSESLKKIGEHSISVDEFKRSLPQTLLEKRDEMEQAAKDLIQTKQFEELINENGFKDKLLNAFIITALDPVVLTDIETKFTDKLNDNQKKLYESLKNTSEASAIKRAIQEMSDAI